MSVVARLPRTRSHVAERIHQHHKVGDWLDKHNLLEIHDRNGYSVDKDSVMDALKNLPNSPSSNWKGQ
jgi:hypothetical protein